MDMCEHFKMYLRKHIYDNYGHFEMDIIKKALDLYESRGFTGDLEDAFNRVAPFSEDEIGE